MRVITLKTTVIFKLNRWKALFLGLFLCLEKCMADIISLQELADAKLDAQSLEQFINGDVDEEVLTRLSQQYPTMQNFLFQFQKYNSRAYKSFADMDADKVNIPAKSKVTVTNDETASNNGDWQWDGVVFTKSAYDPVIQAKTYTESLRFDVFTKTGKNLFDKSLVVVGECFSASLNKIVAGTSWRRSGFIPVEAGKTYTLSGNLSGSQNIAWYATNDKTSIPISYTTSKIAQVAPVGANFAVFNLTNTGQNDATYDSTAQFELGSTPTTYEAYVRKIDKNDVLGIKEIEDSIVEKISTNEIIDFVSFNKINPTACNYTKRYSVALNFVNDTLGIAASDYIAVKEGEWYALSGEYYGNTATPQGGYFTAYGNITALQNIEWSKPVDNIGHCFKVPVGLGITHVVINLKKTAVGSSQLNGNVQLELGEQTTAYKPYDEKKQIKDSLIPLIPNSGGGSSTSLNDAAWYKYTKAEGAQLYPDKLPNFRKHVLLKDKDVCVVNTGTSLTARTSEHCTLHKDAAKRPPMMHSHAFCSHIWDALKWDGQQYRRYDSSYFTETGAFLTSSNLTEWDDGPYRDGLTRYSTTDNASVQFQIPIDAWQFNFIYRSDSVGCDAKITVAEGAGKVQVFDDDTGSWIEAHNYAFSQLEATPVTRTVDIPSNETSSVIPTVLASKGNTTYQKRLRMRCRNENGSIDSRASAKTVTIARDGGAARFMYWGVEWSPRQYMITYINSARGSHNTSATGATGLPRFQDNEIWGFKPDLILSELGIHNDGAAAAGVYPVGRWAGLTHNYITNTDYELSMYSRSAHFSLNPEYAFFTASIAWNFGGINEDGSLKYSLQTASVKGPVKAMSALDKYQEAIQFLRENHPDIVAIDAAKRWVEACIAIYGDMKTATQHIQGINNKSGPYLTNDSSHWNDLGAQIMAKAVLPLI